MKRVTTKAEDRQPALGRIEQRHADRVVVKLPVWLGQEAGHAMLVITEYHDGTLTLAEVQP
jgi:hypothetical protein